MVLFKNIFRKRKKSTKVIKTKPKKPVLDYSELSKIAAANAKNIQGNINQARAMFNALGVRKGKKYKERISRLKKKLEEELFYAEYYKDPSRYHAERIQPKS